MPMQTDLTRMKQGHLQAVFWSVYVSANLNDQQAVQATLEQVDVMKRVIAANPAEMQFCTDAACVEKAWKAGKVASLLGAEGGHSIGGSLAALRTLHEIGVRYMTLTHFKTIAWADSGTDAPLHNGLTDFGKDVVREMNRLGILVDLSHVSQKTMMDALDVSGAPVIFPLQRAGHFRPPAQRVRRRAGQGQAERRRGRGQLLPRLYQPRPIHLERTARRRDGHAKGAAPRPARRRRRPADWEKANPKPVATLADVVAHIDHIKQRIGIDHIALGSDFDGGSVGLQGLPDTSAYPALFVELARKGYTKEDLKRSPAAISCAC
jgi:membrane dipeptidase